MKMEHILNTCAFFVLIMNGKLEYEFHRDLFARNVPRQSVRRLLVAHMEAFDALIEEM